MWGVCDSDPFSHAPNLCLWLVQVTLRDRGSAKGKSHLLQLMTLMGGTSFGLLLAGNTQTPTISVLQSHLAREQ